MSEGLAAAVRAALAGRGQADPRDSAAEKLALTYAGLMDDAAPAGRYRRPLDILQRAVDDRPLETDDPAEALDLIRQALAEHSVASDLGPKLQVTLASLGLTTASRGKTAEGGAPRAGSNPVDRIKQQRERRLSSTG